MPSPQVIEHNKSLFRFVTNGIGSEHGIEHEEIRVSNVVENGGRIFDVLNGRGEKLAQGERDVVKTGLHRRAMDLRDF